MGGFFLPGVASAAYELVRDNPYRTGTRRLINRLWTQFSQVSRDPSFQEDAKENFGQRVWELLLAGVVSENGGRLLPSGDDGPDICVQTTNGVVYIEAMSPGPGQGPDSAQRQASFGRTGMFVCDDRILLRFTGALREKAGPGGQYDAFVKRGTLSPEAPFVVAIDGSRVPDADLPGDFDGPRILKALFPIGPLTWRIVPYSDEEPEVLYPPRPAITKKSGAPVATTAFVSGEYPNVSAVIFDATGIHNVNDLSGRSFHIIHNPHARVPLRHGTFRFGWEWRLSGPNDGEQHFQRTDWRTWPTKSKWPDSWQRFRLRRGVKLWTSRKRRSARGISLNAGDTVLVLGRPRARRVPVMFCDIKSTPTATHMGWLPKKYLCGPLGNDE